ncbi:immunoglobulin superfamily member 23 [Mesoplodon densirostris]|uniref:immunoglobulin superfamily member 23 n=1 Tax=Mesoplodon densirostris TaxID=48708 RepID=UPI0028DCD4B0|nr:immunoglobulin superfamily member 23 [Mesoplodon densirostris]
MRCPLGAAAGSGHSPAWRRMLLTELRSVPTPPPKAMRRGQEGKEGAGKFQLGCCSFVRQPARTASSELPSSASLDPLTEGADAHLPVPRSLDGVLSTSWFRGHKAQPEAVIFSPEGLPRPSHTGRETLDTQGSLVIRNVTTQDAGSYTVVLETSRGRRSVTEQIPVCTANSDGVLLLTFPGNTQGILRSELNYSVILQWVASIEPEPVLRWTFNGHPCGIGERLIIQRLSLEDLGTYVCLAENSQGMYFSQPVTIMLPQKQSRAS